MNRLQQTAAPAPNASAFAFVQELAGELSAGRIDLPSFPDVVVRVRRTLSDDRVTPEMVVRVVGSEPALAGRLLRVANSAALNPGGRAVTDLKTAVTRLGFNAVRSASIAFAVSQLKNAPALRKLKQPLDELWQRSALVAATCHALARAARGINPDEAMLTGLLHGIGKLYILTRAHKHTELFEDTASYQQIVSDWHPQIAKAILENWEISESLIDAVQLQNEIFREHEGPADLGDVLIIADLLASFRKWPHMLQTNLQGVSALARLGLDQQRLIEVIEESEEQIETLRSALA